MILYPGVGPDEEGAGGGGGLPQAGGSQGPHSPATQTEERRGSINRRIFELCLSINSICSTFLP